MFLCVILLTVIGLLAIYSSTLNHPTASANFYKQLAFALISIGVFFGVYFLPHRAFYSMSTPFYIISIIFLIAVLFFGKVVYGAKSWINLGFTGFQPSEFAKIGAILMLAYYLSKPRVEINSFYGLAGALALIMLPISLILLEPDMGTAIVFVSVAMGIIFWKGISLFGLFVVLSPMIISFSSIFGTFVFIAALTLVVAALLFFRKDLFLSASIFVMNLASGFFFEFVYRALSPHQQKRILAFLDPSSDPLGSGYNTIQAKVAIGSGGFFGKGFLSGNQTQLRYIPEQWTDFIYCVIGEEFGFIGSVITLVIFLILFIRVLKIAAYMKEKDEFSGIIAAGIFFLLFIHFLINVGMTVGVVPVIGLPLPFVSYGGSSLIANYFLIGIAANIYKNRKQYA